MMTKVAGILLLLTQVAWAGEIVLRLPDDQLRWALKKAAAWHHCEAAGAVTDQACLEHIGNFVIHYGSGLHLQGLADIGASVEVRYGEDTE